MAVTRTAASPDWADINFAVNGGGPDSHGVTFSGAADHGTQVIVPRGASTWLPGQSLVYNHDIQIIGNGGNIGMDAGNVTPQASNATILTLTGPQFVAATFQGTENVCRISSFVFELTSQSSTPLIGVYGRAYRRRRVSDNVVVGGLRIDHLRFKNSFDPFPNPRTTTSGSNTLGASGTTFVLNVASTAQFPNSGSFNVTGTNPVINYQNKTSTQFTGCTRIFPSATVIAAGTSVSTTIATPVANGAHVIIWGAQSPQGGKGSFINGSFDNNFWDFQPGSSGSEVNSFSRGGAPLNPTYGDGWGEYSWEESYTYGGGDDSDLNVTYIEDNIFHRTGNDLGTLSGGGRFVLRYNTSWGGLSGHGIDGGNMGPSSWEYYNNWFDNRYSGQGAMISLRGGSVVIFNNRITTDTEDIAGQTYRPWSAVSKAIGPASGRNYLDDNWRGTLFTADINAFAGNGGDVPLGQTYVPISTPLDERIGSIYASGSSSSTGAGQITLAGLAGGVTDRWKGFVLVNAHPTNGIGDGSNGDQGSLAAGAGTNLRAYALITGSHASGSDCVVNVATSGNYYILLGTSDPWEIRRVKRYLCNPGAGQLYDFGANQAVHTSGLENQFDTANNGKGTDQGGYYYQTPKTFTFANNGQPVHKYWVSQPAFGNWCLGNLTRTSSATAWGSAAVTTIGSDVTVQGGTHNGALPSYRKNDKAGDFGGNPYPIANSSDPVLVRVGAHWQAPGVDPLSPTGAVYNEGISIGNAQGGVPTQAGGGTYPNPMVTDVASTNPVINSPDHLLCVPGTAISPSFQVTTQNFVGTPTFSLSAPFGNSVTMNGSGVISGTPTGSPADIQRTITAVAGIEGDTQLFTLQVRVGPTVSITSPLAGSPFTEPATIPLQVSASAATGFSQALATIDYYYGSTLIGTVDADAGPPYTFTWTGVTQNSYTLKAIATDNLGLTTTSATVAITVAAPVVVTALPGPTIVVSATRPVEPPIVVAPVITSSLTANATVGIFFSYQIEATNTPTSFSATGRPAGVSIGTLSGIVSGTPTTAATTNITIGATNAVGTGTATLVLTVAPAVTGTGIANNYPGDVNIGTDPLVILADDFESYSVPADMTSKWTTVSGAARMRIATEPGTFFSGTQGLEMFLPISSAEQVDTIIKVLSPTQDVLHVRWYQKWDSGYSVPTSNHNGARISAEYPGPGVPPPTDGSGFFSFTQQSQLAGTPQPGESDPGYAYIYAYWPNQVSAFGDHWYPTGFIKAFGDGPWLTDPASYPDFIARSNFLPQRDRWYCYELMIKANTVSPTILYDGEVKFWVDGNVVGDWPDLFLRNRSTLKIDEAHIVLHAVSNTNRINKKWYDNVVIAKSYIGPMKAL